MKLANKIFLYSLLFFSCELGRSNLSLSIIFSNYDKLSVNRYHRKEMLMPNYFNSTYFVKYNSTSLFGILNYGTIDASNFGHHFIANEFGEIIKYSFVISDEFSDYELIKKSNQWQFNGDPFVAKFTDYENNRVEFLISTYLVKIKNLKYSYDGKKYEELKMKEADFMPYLSIAELKDCFDKKIYFKLEIKKTDVNIKNYPSIFYDTVYLSSK